MNNPLANDLQHILEHTSGLWEELRGKRLFITGGTGFFGCWLLESFAYANEQLELKAEAVVLSRNSSALAAKAPHLLANKSIRFITGDVRDFEFPAGNFSHVIHAATEASAKLNAENPLLMLDTIVTGTRRTLEFARQAGAKKFLLTSSGAVYGPQPPELTHIPEEYAGAPDPQEPGSAYAQGKRTAEHLCALYTKQYGLDTKIARCFAFVGPYLPLDTHFAIGNFIRDAMAGQTISINGDGSPYRSYLYAADLTIWLWTILFQGKTCRPYNVGSANDLNIAALGQCVAKTLGGGQVQIARPPQKDTPPSRYVPQVTRAGHELKLNELISLDTGILRTAQWARAKSP